MNKQGLNSRENLEARSRILDMRLFSRLGTACSDSSGSESTVTSALYSNRFLFAFGMTTRVSQLVSCSYSNPQNKIAYEESRTTDFWINLTASQNCRRLKPINLVTGTRNKQTPVDKKHNIYGQTTCSFSFFPLGESALLEKGQCELIQIALVSPNIERNNNFFKQMIDNHQKLKCRSTNNFLNN